jgi:poly-gamma-glutamate synthase PgsB/CapB
VRRLAAVLRADGRRVFAKTTGSKARWILPDGSERDVPRRGLVSIIEQKRLVRAVAAAGAEVLVAEAMSLQAEYQRVEAERLVRPHVVVLTNARRDHTEAMGPTEETVAEVLACGVPDGAKLFVPDAECRPIWRRVTERGGGQLHVVPPGTWSGEVGRTADALFPDNLDLVAAVGRYLGASEAALEAGLQKAAPDPGALRLWRWSVPAEQGGGERRLVSAFAANDPDSSRRTLVRLFEWLVPETPPEVFGLLVLRADRGDRTAQWIAAMRQGLFADLSGLFVSGPGSRIVARRCPGTRVLEAEGPGELTRQLVRQTSPGSWIVGLGNIVGEGERLLALWEAQGVPLGDR